MSHAFRHSFLATVAAVGLAAFGLAAAPPASSAPAPQPLALLPGSKLWLEGDSTLHPYKASTSQLTITASLSPDAGERRTLAKLEAVVPVTSLKSGIDALDANLYKAMRADRHPAIRFRMTGGDVRVAGGGKVAADVDGVLAIAGAEKATTIHAEGRLSGDTFRVTGTKELAMTMFGIEPPNLMMGAIRCADRIVVKFELAIRAKADQEATR